jgi:hypothetical protein
VFQPGDNQLLLSLAANSPTITRRLASVDVTNRTVTLAGTTPETLAVDTSATILRQGQFVPMTSLVVGDRLTLAFVRAQGSSRVLAIQAVPGPVTPTGRKSKK